MDNSYKKIQFGGWTGRSFAEVRNEVYNFLDKTDMAIPKTDTELDDDELLDDEAELAEEDEESNELSEDEADVPDKLTAGE